MWAEQDRYLSSHCYHLCLPKGPQTRGGSLQLFDRATDRFGGLWETGRKEAAAIFSSNCYFSVRDKVTQVNVKGNIWFGTIFSIEAEPLQKEIHFLNGRSLSPLPVPSEMAGDVVQLLTAGVGNWKMEYPLV